MYGNMSYNENSLIDSVTDIICYNTRIREPLYICIIYKTAPDYLKGEGVHLYMTS